jgi:hypothetical protein
MCTGNDHDESFTQRHVCNEHVDVRVCKCTTPPDLETNPTACGNDCDAQMFKIDTSATRSDTGDQIVSP